MKAFKTYLETQLNIYEVNLKGILKEIENIPDPPEINITLYGTKEEIKKAYKKDLQPNIFKRIIGPSMLDLQIYTRNREILRLRKQKCSLERTISQVKNAIDSIKENHITKEIWPNEEIYILLLEYASTRNINPKELLDFFVELCKYSKENDKVEDKIKKNIARFFDEEGKILKDTKLSALTLLLDKLFMCILSSQEDEKYSLVINQLIVQLKVEKDRVTKLETKPELELKRRALIELQDYINGTIIIKILDIENFKLLLETAGISQINQNRLIEQMTERIEEERKEEQRKQEIQVVERYLEEKDIELLRKADQKANSSIGPISDLIKRAIKDVISMCKYLSYTDQIGDIHESLEILEDRIRVVKNILANLELDEQTSNTLFYLTDNEGIPVLLRNLEVYEVTEYMYIYNLLYKAANKNQGKRFASKDNIDFYYLRANQLRLVYADTNNCRIIVGIDGYNSINTIKKSISKEVITKINEISNRSSNKTYREIHATYENVILDSLNIKDQSYTLSLKRKED